MLASQGAQAFRRSRSTFRAIEPCGFRRRREMVSTTICGEVASWLSSVRVISESTGRVAIPCRGHFRGEVFVHISAVEKVGYSNLAEGARVSYELVAGRSGKMSAENLRLG